MIVILSDYGRRRSKEESKEPEDMSIHPCRFREFS